MGCGSDRAKLDEQSALPAGSVNTEGFIAARWDIERNS
jgi:hypothetical protein